MLESKNVFSRPGVPERVKKSMRTLLLCMSNVFGTNAHRTTLRHLNNSYKLLVGAPLIFTTPNFADARSLIVNLMYEGKEVTGWRLLEEGSPVMPSTEDMMRRVACDPMSQALVFDLMVKLFLEHFLGVDLHRKWSDGVASSGNVGLFGPVQADFAPEETQGRRGLHAHMHVWILNPLRASMLEKLRSGNVSQEMIQTLKQWRLAVIEKVSTIQFDSIEDVSRQLNLVGDHRLKRVPFTRAQQCKTYSSEDFGVQEVDDCVVKASPEWAKSRKPLDEYGADRWVVDLAHGPKRMVPHVQLAAVEPDPHEVGKTWIQGRRVPMTGAHLCRIP